MDMNKKITTIIIVGLFLITIFNSISAVELNVENEKTNQDYDEPLILMNSSDDRHMTLKIKYVGMQDCVDLDGGQLNNYADWYFKIWVDQGTDDNGDDYWEPWLPEGNWELRPKIDHTWNIGQNERVNIRLEIWDDDGLLDDLCDVHGKSGDEPENRVLELIYNPVTNNLDTGDSGGYDYGGDGWRFHGGWDDSSGAGCEMVNDGADDDDVELIIDVYDDYRPATFKLEAEEGLTFYANDVNQCTRPKNFTLINTGTVPGTCSVSLKGENTGQFEIIEGAGTFTLAAGEEITIKVKFCPTDKSKKTCSIFADGDDSCKDGSKKLAGVMNNKPDWMFDGPSGVHYCSINKAYSLYMSPVDKDNDKVWFKIDWDSSKGEISKKYGPYNPNSAYEINYKFKEKGRHIISASIIDEHQGESSTLNLTVYVFGMKSNSALKIPDIFSRFSFIRQIFSF